MSADSTEKLDTRSISFEKVAGKFKDKSCSDIAMYHTLADLCDAKEASFFVPENVFRKSEKHPKVDELNLKRSPVLQILYGRD